MSNIAAFRLPSYVRWRLSSVSVADAFCRVPFQHHWSLSRDQGAGNIGRTKNHHGLQARGRNRRTPGRSSEQAGHRDLAQKDACRSHLPALVFRQSPMVASTLPHHAPWGRTRLTGAGREENARIVSRNPKAGPKKVHHYASTRP